MKPGDRKHVVTVLLGEKLYHVWKNVVNVFGLMQETSCAGVNGNECALVGFHFVLSWNGV